MSSPHFLVQVLFRDGITGRYHRQVYRKPVLPGEPTEFVVRGGRTVWVRRGSTCYVEA